MRRKKKGRGAKSGWPVQEDAQMAKMFIGKECYSKCDLPRFLSEVAEQKLPSWATAKDSIRIRKNRLSAREGNRGGSFRNSGYSGGGGEDTSGCRAAQELKQQCPPKVHTSSVFYLVVCKHNFMFVSCFPEYIHLTLLMQFYY